ncbi:hypothetical protein [Endozoicomonas sp. 4G]|uniref:hypothetical protein n=1 Tax=Endozoicomonas sp. 4G TaxID=2872754 RepID=UPI002078BBDF|nr:hypothetical protein [Endozoicomonas sp. 4G]
MTTPVNSSSNKTFLSTSDIASTQKPCNSQTSGATCYNRSVECAKPSLSIKIDESKKSETDFTKLHENGLKDRVVLKYFPFEIDGTVFNCIDGNERDNELAKKMINICDDWPNSAFSFNIKTEDGDHDYQPSHSWQERLLRCINVGLQSLFDECPPETVPVLGKKTMGEIYKGRKIQPTCFQFVNFMECNSSSYHDNFQVKFTTLKELDKNHQFTPLAILKDNDIIHIFIHIGDNVCIGKMESRNIYFHTTEDILSHYQAIFETPLSLVVAKIQPLQ